jgi:hypothetical protein
LQLLAHGEVAGARGLEQSQVPVPHGAKPVYQAAASLGVERRGVGFPDLVEDLLTLAERALDALEVKEARIVEGSLESPEQLLEP